jgi:hypothetical protein
VSPVVGFQPTSGVHGERRRSVYGSAGAEGAVAPRGAPRRWRMSVREHGPQPSRLQLLTVAQREKGGGGVKKIVPGECCHSPDKRGNQIRA